MAQLAVLLALDVKGKADVVVAVVHHIKREGRLVEMLGRQRDEGQKELQDVGTATLERGSLERDGLRVLVVVERVCLVDGLLAAEAVVGMRRRRRFVLRNVVLVRLYDDALTHKGGYLKPVFVADNGDVVALKADNHAASDFVEEPYLISDFHRAMYSLL